MQRNRRTIANVEDLVIVFKRVEAINKEVDELWNVSIVNICFNSELIHSYRFFSVSGKISVADIISWKSRSIEELSCMR